MQVKFFNKGNTTIACIAGELDHHNVQYLRAKVDSEILKINIKNVILDFDKVTFMDSSGIGAIMGRYKNIISMNGKMGVVNLNKHIKQIYIMSGMEKFIPEYDTVEVALKKISEGV